MPDFSSKTLPKHPLELSGTKVQRQVSNLGCMWRFWRNLRIIYIDGEDSSRRETYTKSANTTLETLSTSIPAIPKQREPSRRSGERGRWRHTHTHTHTARPRIFLNKRTVDLADGMLSYGSELQTTKRPKQRNKKTIPLLLSHIMMRHGSCFYESNDRGTWIVGTSLL